MYCGLTNIMCLGLLMVKLAGNGDARVVRMRVRSSISVHREEQFVPASVSLKMGTSRSARARLLEVSVNRASWLDSEFAQSDLWRKHHIRGL